jgi:hypothetical protein
MTPNLLYITKITKPLRARGRDNSYTSWTATTLKRCLNFIIIVRSVKSLSVLHEVDPLRRKFVFSNGFCVALLEHF